VNTTADATLDGLLRTLDALGGSDLHLRPGSPARARVHGDLRVLPGHDQLVRRGHHRVHPQAHLPQL